MAGYVHKSNLAVDAASISAMTRGPAPMKHEAMRLNDRDKFAKSAFYAGQGTGSQTVESPSGLLPESV